MFDPIELLGTTFAGKFEIHDLESEQSRIVYRAYDTVLKRDVALKVSPPSGDGRAAERLHREAIALARVAHPNTPVIYEAGTDPTSGLHYVVMEWIPGVRASEIADLPLSEAQVLRIAHDVAASLGRAHTFGITNRDLRAQNVMLSTDPAGRPIAKVLDFTVAGFDESYELTRLTAPDEVVGSFGTISPEQARGEAVDARTDVYSYGAFVYQLVCGRLPFEGSPMEILQAHLEGKRPRIKAKPGLELSPLLEALLKRCMRIDPAERFQNCSAVDEVLSNVERERGLDNPRAIHAVAVDDPYRYVVVGRGDGSIDAYEAESGRRIGGVDAHRGPVTDLAFRPETEEFLSAGSDGHIHLWSISEMCRAGTWPGLRGQQFTLGFSPFGYIFASGDTTGRVRLWSLLEQRPLGELDAHDGPVTAIHFLPEGRYVATGGHDGTLALWDLGTLELAERAEWTLGPITHLAMHVQERFVVAFDDGSMAMGRWRKTDGPVWHERVHEKRVSRLLEQHGGQGVFSVGLDGAIHCIDIFDGQARKSALHHVGGIHAATLHSRSERLFASSDSVLLRWTWTPGGKPVLEGFLPDKAKTGWMSLSPR